MTVQLTIIGLGQIGASAGLTLANHTDQVTRLGHDRDPNTAKQAQKLGAVDKVLFNLPAAVENAEIVLLALPLDQVRATLQVIGPCLQENTVVLDTSPIKSAVTEWVKEFLPAKCHYVGLIPAINPLYLHAQEKGIEAARADLFAKGLMAVAAPPGTAGDAIKLAADFSTLLGAAPFFMDLAEADSMMVSLHVLPQLTAAALTNVVMEKPSWKDARKLAGRIYAGATLPVMESEEDNSLLEMALQNRASVVHVLGEMITSLEDLRAAIMDQEQDRLADRLESARLDRSKWWRERSAGDWQSLESEKLGVTKISLWKRLFGDLGKLIGSPKSSEEQEK